MSGCDGCGGAGINPSTPSTSVSWADVLAVGATTGVTDPIISSGQAIRGQTTAGVGGAVQIVAAAGVAGNAGGAASLTGGAGNGAAVGGVASLVSGAGGATGAGATTLVTGGAGGSASGAAGGVTVAGGIPVNGAGGSVALTASAGVGINRAGGAASVMAGAATGNAAAGIVTITAGAAGVGGGQAGGSIRLVPGAGDGAGAQGTVSINVDAHNAFFRMGLAAGSGAGSISASSTGNFRIADLWIMSGRNAADTTNTQLAQWTGGQMQWGSTQVALTRVVSSTEVTLLIGVTSVLRVLTSGITVNTNLVTFNSTTTVLTGAGLSAASSTGTLLTLKGVDTTGIGTNQAGGILVQAGKCTGLATNNTAGDATFAAGDASNATAINAGGNTLVRGGTGVNGTTPSDGNVALHASPSSWFGTQRTVFVGNTPGAAPTSPPVAGGFLQSIGGAPVWYGSTGAVTAIGATGSNSAKKQQFHTSARIGEVSTVNVATATSVSYDLSSVAGELGSFNNCGIVAKIVFQGWTAAGEYCRLERERSFTRLAGVTAAADAAAITLGTDFTTPLAGVTVDVDNSGDTIRGRVTGIAGKTIIWTSYLNLIGTTT